MAAILDIIIYLLVFTFVYTIVGIFSNRQMLNQVLLGLDNPKKSEIIKILSLGIIISFGLLIVNLVHVFIILFNWWDDTVSVPPTWIEIFPYIITELILCCGFLIAELLIYLYYLNYMKIYHLTQ
ncbi:MAG: hypothetical protein ACTSX4_06865 [Candidatus Helarchaeota archaeon]